MVWMDVGEAERRPRKAAAEETRIPPLVLSEKSNAITRRPRTREVTSRYKAATTSPSLSTPVVPRRCPSPIVTRTVATSSPSLPKRAQSAERRRPSTPPSPPTPSTPVQDSSVEMQISSRRVLGGRTPEGLWPSTMRSLCVSFQSEIFSVPISKREKTVTHPSSDHTLKPSANVVHKQGETPVAQRKATPERRRSPLRGKKASNQSENSKPADNSHARVVDQHKWPNRNSGKVAASALIMDLTDKSSKAASLTLPGRGVSPPRRTPMFDGLGSHLQKSVSELAKQVSHDESGRVEFEMFSVDDASLRLSGPQKFVPSSVGIFSSSLERTLSNTYTSISRSPRPLSPSKASFQSSSLSKGMLSPSRTRPSNLLVSSLTSRSSNSSSVLSFIADVKKGKKGVNHIEDAHQLRLLYNRYLQWRYANAQTDAALSIQKVSAEKTLSNVWNTTSELRDSVIMKRISLQKLRQEWKLNSVLNAQVAYLDDWALLERDHLNSLAGAIEALEASTLHLPLTGGARADIHSIKDAVCSAVDVMQTMGCTICYLLSKVEGMNRMVSELAEVAAQERTMLDECRDLLASTAAMQIAEKSLKTHLIQLNQAFRKEEQPISALRELA